MKKIYKYDLDIEELALIADTLDNTELGIFMRLEWYYIRLGYLPTDKKDLYLLCRAKNNKLQQATDRVVAKFNSTFGSQRLDKERARILKKKDDCSEAGKESAQRRTRNENSAEPENSSGNLPNHQNNNDSPSTNVQPPTTTTIIKERDIDKSISLKKVGEPPPKKKIWKEDQEFRIFWEKYPRRPGDSPADAYRVYLKVIEKEEVTHAELQAAAARYAESRAGEPIQYTMQAATWLNPNGKRGWECDWSQQKSAVGATRKRALGDCFSDYLLPRPGFRDGEAPSDGGNLEQMRVVN